MKKIFENFILQIKVWSFSINNVFIYSYNKEWDKIINELFEKYPIIAVSKYAIRLGDTYIWIETNPHATFTPLFSNNKYIDSIRPSKKTIYLLNKKFRNKINKLIENPSEEEKKRYVDTWHNHYIKSSTNE